MITQTVATNRGGDPKDYDALRAAMRRITQLEHEIETIEQLAKALAMRQMKGGK